MKKGTLIIKGLLRNLGEILGVSEVAISGVISRVTLLMTHIRGLITTYNDP